MKHILIYTKQWLDQILPENKELNGHDFFSMSYKVKRAVKEDHPGVENIDLNGLYYALSLIGYFISPKGKDAHRWSFLNNEDLKENPGYSSDTKDRQLIWNLKHELDMVKSQIDWQVLQTRIKKAENSKRS